MFFSSVSKQKMFNLKKILSYIKATYNKYCHVPYRIVVFIYSFVINFISNMFLALLRKYHSIFNETRYWNMRIDMYIFQKNFKKYIKILPPKFFFFLYRRVKEILFLLFPALVRSVDKRGKIIFNNIKNRQNLWNVCSEFVLIFMDIFFFFNASLNVILHKLLKNFYLWVLAHEMKLGSFFAHWKYPGRIYGVIGEFCYLRWAIIENESKWDLWLSETLEAIVFYSFRRFIRPSLNIYTPGQLYIHSEFVTEYGHLAILVFYRIKRWFKWYIRRIWLFFFNRAAKLLFYYLIFAERHKNNFYSKLDEVYRIPVYEYILFHYFRWKIKLKFWCVNKEIFKYRFFINLHYIVTLVYAALFLCIQLYEYNTTAFDMTDGAFGSIFYLITGFHGLHVIIGFIFIYATAEQSGQRALTSRNHLCLVYALWYWHFVDIVWIFLLIFVYWWGGSNIETVVVTN